MDIKAIWALHHLKLRESSTKIHLSFLNQYYMNNEWIPLSIIVSCLLPKYVECFCYYVSHCSFWCPPCRFFLFIFNNFGLAFKHVYWTSKEKMGKEVQLCIRCKQREHETWGWAYMVNTFEEIIEKRVVSFLCLHELGLKIFNFLIILLQSTFGLEPANFNMLWLQGIYSFFSHI